MLDLQKGQSTMFEKSVKEVVVEARWTGAHDPDIFAVAQDKDGRMVNESACFFNKTSLFNGAIRHSGDARDGDSKPVTEADETMWFQLNKIPEEIVKIQVFLSIFDAELGDDGIYKQNFGQMQQMEATIITDGKKVAVIDLADKHGTCISMTMLEITRKDGRWSVTPIQQQENLTIGDYFAKHK